MIRRALIALLLLGATWSAQAQCTSAFVGFTGAAVQACVSDDPPGQVSVPDVIGEADSAAADTILEGEGLDLGTVSTRCSAETLDEIISQNPQAGVMVDLGSLVNVTASNGEECSGRPLRRMGLGLEMKR